MWVEFTWANRKWGRIVLSSRGGPRWYTKMGHYRYRQAGEECSVHW